MTLGDARQSSLLTASWLQAGRLLKRWRRDRAVLMGSLLFPIGLLLLYEVVLGDQVQKVTGVDSTYGLVPVCAVLSAFFGTLGNSVGITLERQSGLLSRMWVLPVHRASALTGRFTAEAVRAFVGTVLITIVGLFFGLRFKQGWGAVLPYILIPSIVSVGFTALVMALVIRDNGRALRTWLVGGIIALAFVNPGITPIALFPEWLQPFVRLQPMSPPIEAMRGLALGGPLLLPLLMTVAWTVILLIVFTPLAIRGYRRAAETSA